MTLQVVWWILIPALAVGVLAVWQRRWLRVAAAVTLAVIATQPQFGNTAPQEPPTGTDVVLIVDRTTSMSAQDYDGHRPRMEGMAADVARIVAEMPQARFSVITSDNVARVAAPWTTDGQAIVTLAATIGWREESYGTGSDISAAVPVARDLLATSTTSRPGATRYLVYLGDGEQTSEQEPSSFAPLKDVVDGAKVLGYGTAEGGAMIRSVGSDEPVTRDGVVQKSSIDEAALQRIAEQLGGEYIHRTGPVAISLWPSHVAPAPELEQGPVQWGWIFAPVATVLVAADLLLTARRARAARKEAR